MKKIVFLFLMTGFFCMVSCKKDRVCECTSDGVTFKITLNDAGKRQAKDYCVSETEDNGDGTYTKWECKLKK